MAWFEASKIEPSRATASGGAGIAAQTGSKHTNVSSLRRVSLIAGWIREGTCFGNLRARPQTSGLRTVLFWKTIHVRIKTTKRESSSSKKNI